MVILRRHIKGWTLVELMLVVSIIGVMVSVGPHLLIQIKRFLNLSQTKVELQRDARTTMDLIIRRMRQATSSSININQLSGQPYYSRIQFSDIDNSTFICCQQGSNLILVVNGSSRTITTNLRYLAFALPRSDDMGIISISMTLEKRTYESQTKALHMASEKVRIMN